MLYDPKWQKPEVKVDPFSLESLIAWLEKQPLEQAYDYKNCKGRCLFGQYTASHGLDWRKQVIGVNLIDIGQEALDFKRMVYEEIASPSPWTFGAALERARAALLTVDGGVSRS